MWEDTYIPVPGQSENKKKIKLKNRIVKLKEVFKRGGVLYFYNKKLILTDSKGIKYIKINLYLKLQQIVSIQLCSIKTPDCERKTADIHEYWYVFCLPLVVAFPTTLHEAQV